MGHQLDDRRHRPLHLSRRALARLHRAGPSEALGYGWLNVLHPDDREKTVETLRSVLDMSKPFRIEFRVRRPDGVYRWALAVGAPRFGESGALPGYVGSIVDIDDRRATEASLAASEDARRSC